MSPEATYQSVVALDADALVETHAPLVKRIAEHLRGRLPDNVETDDLVQVGLMALLEAARKYSADKGARFETYAGIRIRGAMLDEVRAMGWTPRSVHRKQREISMAMHALEQETGREARAEDVAEKLGVSMDEYHKMAADSVSAKLTSFDQLTEGDDHRASIPAPCDDPAAFAEKSEFRSMLAEVIGNLPEREALVMALYYDEELNLKEIGQVLEVSESRVCQIHGQALARVRSRLHEARSHSSAA